MTQYSIMVVEDDEDLLERLTTIIAPLPNFTLTHAADTFRDAQQFLAKQAPAVLLTDLGLPDGDGIELIREAYDKYPDTLIMVLSAFGDEQRVISAIMAGAKGYILKEEETVEIESCLNQLVAGGSPISASIARYLLVKLRNETTQQPSISLLTERESQVLEYVALGYRNAEIADKLFISYHTVVNHIRNIYDKLAVSSRSQAIHKASQLGLLRG